MKKNFYSNEQFFSFKYLDYQYNLYLKNKKCCLHPQKQFESLICMRLMVVSYRVWAHVHENRGVVDVRGSWLLWKTCYKVPLVVTLDTHGDHLVVLRIRDVRDGHQATKKFVFITQVSAIKSVFFFPSHPVWYLFWTQTFRVTTPVPQYSHIGKPCQSSDVKHLPDECFHQIAIDADVREL